MKPNKSRIPKNKKQTILSLYNKGHTFGKISNKVGVPKTTVYDFIHTKEAQERLYGTMDSKANILYLDVEVSASVILAFPRWNVNVHKEGVLKEPYMLTYAAAWGDGEVFSSKLTDFDIFDIDRTNDYALISGLWKLLDKSDIVIAHNAKFDVGWFNQRCAYWNIAPPSPYKVICTLKEIKKNFSLPANSLDAAAKYFGLTEKLSHSGLGLWKDAMNGSRDAFDELEEYNIGDIITLRELYLKVRPFIKSHPNVSLFDDEDVRTCYKCGSSDLSPTNKYSITSLGKFELYFCNSCNSFNSDKTNVLDKDKRDSLNRGTI